jgi:hypothetical protein
MCLEKPTNLAEKIRKAMLQSQSGADAFGPKYDEDVLINKLGAIVAGHRGTSGEGAVVNLQMTLEQANSVSDALDVYTRLGIGQLQIIGEMVRMGAIPLQIDSNQPRQHASYEQGEQFSDLIDAAKAVLGYPSNGSNGIGHKHVSIQFHRGYEVKKVIDAAVANYRNPTPEFRTVNYDGLNLRFTKDPAPKAFVQK